MPQLGVGLSNTSLSGSPSASTPSYQTVIGYTRTEVTVPLVLMTCSDNTLVFLNGALIQTNYTRVANTYTFNFDLIEGDYLLFKN